MSPEKNSTDKHADQEQDPGLSRIYHRFSQEVTPEKLDEDILQYARKHHNARRRRSITSPFGSNWTIPVSLAAVLLISVALVPVIRQELQAPKQTSREDSRIPVSRSNDQAPAPTLVEKKSEAIIRMQDKAEINQNRTESGEESARENTAMRMKQQSASPASSTPLSMQAADPALSETTRKEKAAVAEIAGAAEAAGSQYNPQDPEAWLKYIQKLLDENKTAEAKSSYQSFLEQYPEYPVEHILGKNRNLLEDSN